MASRKISESNQEQLPIRKNLSELLKDSFNRFALDKGIVKIVPYVADNVFFVTTKTVDARFRDGQWTVEDVRRWLEHSGDRILAEFLKDEINQWVRRVQ